MPCSVGTTLVITGADNASHELQFRLVGGNDEIIDTVGFDSKPGDCTFVSDPTWMSCPPHNDVRVDLGGGDDRVYFTHSTTPDCFGSYLLNLGDGANTLNLSEACDSASTATVTSGSGQDTLYGGSQGSITFFAGGGDDGVYGGFGDDVVHGGEGNDRLLGGTGNDQILGEGGDDAPIGDAGNDLVDGGAGDDQLKKLETNSVTGVGADTYVGGPGTDKLWFNRHANGVAISIDGAANDGAPGEGDHVGSDIEAIEGSPGNDGMTGSAAVDTFDGGAGNDEIHGGGGADDLRGSGGDDRLFGDAGDDKVQGDPGADTVDGGAGADQLYGDIAGCSVFCSFDSDTLLARDGELDRVDCGGGADAAQVDFSDVVAFCASIDRSPATTPPPPGPPPPPPAPPPFGVTFGSTTIGKPTRAKGVSADVRCSANIPATLRLTVTNAAGAAKSTSKSITPHR